MGNDINDSSTKNNSLKNKKSSHDRKRWEESKAKLLKQIDDDNRASLIMSRMEKQTKEHF